MRRLRASALPTLLLTLLGGFGALGTEAGHSRAHQQSHDLLAHEHEPAASALPVSAGWEEGHGAPDHGHLDLRATIPVRSMVPVGGPPAPVSELPVPALPAVRRTPVAISHGLAPPVQQQSTPPPTRSPPLA